MLIEFLHQLAVGHQSFNDARFLVYNIVVASAIVLLWPFPSDRTDVDIKTMEKDPLLKQLVNDQDWHIWMDDRRSLLSYPVVGYRRQFQFSHTFLLCFPFQIRFADGLYPARLGIIGYRRQVCYPLFLP